MGREQKLDLYLPPHLRKDHDEGNNNILSAITAALPGWQLNDCPQDDGEVQNCAGYGLTYMKEPLFDHVLCLRRAYFYPFWRIEPTNERWQFRVAKRHPVYDDIDAQESRRFLRRMQNRVFGQPVVEGLAEDFIYMPLQGKLLDHRSFQSMSPIDMIETTLAQEPDTPIYATLHPAEEYNADELAALERIEAKYSRFKLIKAHASDMILNCRYIVTQNSSVALQGLIARKGAVLFGHIDFHHIVGSVPRDGVQQAFEIGQEPPLAMAKYLWWFLQVEAINAQAKDAPKLIRGMLKNRYHWPVAPV